MINKKWHFESCKLYYFFVKYIQSIFKGMGFEVTYIDNSSG